MPGTGLASLKPATSWTVRVVSLLAHISSKGNFVSEQNKKRIAEFLDRLLSSGEISAAGEYFHTDMAEEVPFAGKGPGITGLKETRDAPPAAGDT